MNLLPPNPPSKPQHETHNHINIQIKNQKISKKQEKLIKNISSKSIIPINDNNIPIVRGIFITKDIILYNRKQKIKKIATITLIIIGLLLLLFFAFLLLVNMMSYYYY